MKATLILLALATSALAGPPILVRTTPEAVAALQQKSPMSRLQQPQEGDAKVVSPAGQSILKQSIILHDGKNWTIVPKGAVVFLPEELKSRVDAKPVGNLLTFSEFQTANRGWITTDEVTFEQAAGLEPLSAESAAFWAKQDKMVIAVHQNGPISVNVDSGSQPITQR